MVDTATILKLIIALHDYYSLELELECLELVALGTS